MKMISRAIALALGLGSAIGLWAQKAPEWLNQSHLDLPNSRIGVYVGVGSTEEEAANNAIGQVLKENSLATGLRTEVRISANGEFTAEGSDNLKTKARRLDSYHKRQDDGRHYVYILAQVAKSPAFDYDRVSVTNSYRLIPESFVPGMAQIKKGSIGKGVGFISAEALCIGAIIVSEAQRSSYRSKMNTTHNAQQKQHYKEKSDSWATARNIAIAGTAAVYIWNVIDGIVAKGKRHLAVDGKDMVFAPVISPEGYGLAMRITF